MINSSLIERNAKRNDIKSYRIPVNDIANTLGNAKVANMVALGALIGATEAVRTESVLKAFEKMFTKKPELLEVNRLALTAGISIIN